MNFLKTERRDKAAIFYLTMSARYATFLFGLWGGESNG